MRKHFLTTLTVLFVLLLSGCQTTSQAPSHLFRPFSSAFTPSASLAQTVQEALMRNEDPAIAQIQVQTRQEVVILTGYVKKIRQSDVAEQIARQVPGVRAVENNIIIRQ